MPTRTIDSAARLLDRLRAENYKEIKEASLVYFIEEEVGNDPRTKKAHLSFLLKHDFVRPKQGSAAVFLINYDRLYGVLI